MPVELTKIAVARYEINRFVEHYNKGTTEPITATDIQKYLEEYQREEYGI